MEIYVIIKKHSEGYSLVYPALTYESALGKITELRKVIEDLNIRAKEANKDFDEDGDEIDCPWTKMFLNNTIDSFEWENGLWTTPDSYCARIWNSYDEKFECNCTKLGLGIDHSFIF